MVSSAAARNVPGSYLLALICRTHDGFGDKDWTAVRVHPRKPALTPPTHGNIIASNRELYTHPSKKGPAWTLDCLPLGTPSTRVARSPGTPTIKEARLLEAEAYKQNFREIEHIEDAGWDYVWFGGGHFSTQGSMDPQSLMLSAVIANHTENIRIGTSIHRPTLRLPGEAASARALPHERYAFDNLQPEDPFQVAEQVAIVDQISEGRFIYGAGARTRGSAERREYFFEYLELLKQLWEEDRFSGFEGKYFSYPAFYESYMSIPKPVQKPMPMLLPVDSQESFVPMGEQGYRIAIGAGSSPHNLRGSAVLREDVKAYRKAWIEAGHEGDPATVVRVPTLVADTKEKGGAAGREPHGPRPHLLRGTRRHRQH